MLFRLLARAAWWLYSKHDRFGMGYDEAARMILDETPNVAELMDEHEEMAR